jgi:hypothetical protein
MTTFWPESSTPLATIRFLFVLHLFRAFSAALLQ